MILLQGNGAGGIGADNAVEGLGFYLFLAVLIGVALYLLHRARRRRRGKGGPPGAWLVLVAFAVVAIAEDAGAQGVAFGVHRLDVGPDDIVRLADEPLRVCVFAPGAQGDVTLRHAGVEGEDFLLFVQDGVRRTCRLIEGGGSLTLESGRSVRVLTMEDTPRRLGTPGVVRLGPPGSVVMIDALGERAEVGVLAEAVGARVQLVDEATLEVYAEVEGPAEKSIAAGEAVPAGRSVLVVVASGVVSGGVSVRWEDPDWYRKEPTIGHVAVAVAAALFLMLYRGSSSSWHRPGR